MKKVSLGLLLLVGCVSYVPPQASFSAVAPVDSGDLYACAMRQLMTMEYTIDDADRESGWVRARKKMSRGAVWDGVLGSVHHRVLVVTILDALGDGGRTMRVTASGIMETTKGFARGSESTGPIGDPTRADAQAVLSECVGSGVVEAI